MLRVCSRVVCYVVVLVAGAAWQEMETKDDSICKNNDVEIKRNLFKINRGTKKIFNIFERTVIYVFSALRKLCITA